MCMPICLSQIEPINGTWTERSNAFFRSQVRADIPIVCELESNPNTKGPKENIEDKVPARDRRGVINAKNLKSLINADLSLEEKLVDPKKSTHSNAKFVQ